MGRTSANVLKVRKQKRQGRRAYLTNVYSVMRVPRNIGKSAIPDHVKSKQALETAEKLFDYRSRAVIDVELESYLNSIFPGVKQVSERRKYCINKAEEEKLLAMICDPDVCDFVTLLKETPKRQRRITMVYNRQQSRVYFLEVNYLGKDSYVMKSIVYGSRDNALFDFHHKRISWLEFLPLASLQLVLPRRD